jgi:hypothetical protein
MKTTRREFLSAAAAAPVLLGLQDKAGTKAPVVGTGAHTYEAVHDWGTLPPRLKWGNTHGVVQDSEGLIYVHHTVHATSDSADSMVVFDPEGRFVRSWGSEMRGVAHGLHIRREGSDEFLYLTVNAANAKMTPQPAVQAAVLKMTKKGEIVWKIQGPPDVEAYRPAPDGTPKRQYNSKAEYIRTFGGRGSEPGKLAEPHGIWVDTRGASPLLVVADRANNRLQRFTLDGTHVDFVQGVRRPCHFDERGGIVVVPDLHGRVTLIGRNNEVLAHLGDSNPGTGYPLRTQPRESFIPGQFICPHGACFDRDGNIFVVEWVEIGRVTKLRKV